MHKLKIGFKIVVITAASLVSSAVPQGLHAQGTGPTAISPPFKPLPAKQSPAEESKRDLKLDQSTLHAIAPLLGEKVSRRGFTRELIQVRWRANDPIDLYVIAPTNVGKPPVVLFLYGYPSDTGRFLDDDYCASVTSHGFAAVGFVSALTGQRYHDRPMKEWFLSELPEALTHTVHDVQMILDYLATRNDLDMQRVGMYGQGSGGTIAILAASVDPRLKAIDVLDPWGAWPAWLANSPLIPDDERPSFLTTSYLDSVDPYDPAHVLARWHDTALRVQQMMFSKATPASARDAIRAATPSTADVLVYKDKESYDLQAKSSASILDWLGNKLVTNQAAH